MVIYRTRIRKNKSIFILLVISFAVTLLMLLSILDIYSKEKYAQMVQKQCEFKTAYQLDWEAREEENSSRAITGEELIATMPDVSQGILSISVFLDESEYMEFCQLQYLFGDYEQLTFPLQAGGKVCVDRDKTAFYVGERYIPYLIKRSDENFLNLDGAELLINGVLADITAKGRDDRLILLGKGVPEILKEKLQSSLECNQVVIRYFSNEADCQQDIENILAWLGQKTDYQFEVSSYDQMLSYNYNSALNMYFLEKAFYPILICCLCNVFLIVRVYIKKMRKAMFIYRTCGMNYKQLALMVGTDYSIVLLPVVLLMGALHGQLEKLLILGVILWGLFTFISIGLIRWEFNKEGWCL